MNIFDVKHQQMEYSQTFCIYSIEMWSDKTGLTKK